MRHVWNPLPASRVGFCCLGLPSSNNHGDSKHSESQAQVLSARAATYLIRATEIQKFGPDSSLEETIVASICPLSLRCTFLDEGNKQVSKNCATLEGMKNEAI